MELTNMTVKERFAMMRKRHTFLTETIKGYTSLEEYAHDKDEWFAVIGISLELERFESGDIVSLAVFLDVSGEREEYFVKATEDGRLTVDEEVWMLDGDCNILHMVNIFSEEDID